MKIAYLLGSLNRGGMETLMLDVLKSADKAAFEFVVVHRKGGAMQEAFYQAGGESMRSLSPRFPFAPSYVWKLRQLLLQEKVQIVHAHQRIDCLYAWLATRGTGIKVVQTFHGFDYLGGRANKRRVKHSLTKADLNVFVSESERQEYIREFPRQMAKVPSTVVYNGIDFSKIGSPQATFQSALRPLEIGTVGNFVAGRQQSYLCLFADALKKSGVQFNLYFVGKRDNNEPWRYDNCVQYCNEYQLEDCVHFLGSRSDVPQLLQQWDAFVYATDHDTFGIAVVEAMAAGLPVFVNDHPVMKEITRNGELATLYKTGNKTDLVDKVKEFVENRSLFLMNAVKAADSVRSLYSIENHIKTLYKAYYRLLNVE